ncbi:failed axon connections isoform X2 [Contarinia nasturtii]|uniref:failed axon connections isoform X2 n=1 Tax=Contarinia nasturtii TaxID=265458 RepID=UPI0012D3A606|nr:failed axon connections isoform X2 [Contarinia nasturtii]
MATEVANNQAVSAPAPEENAAEKKVEEVEAAVKDGDANAPAKTEETAENAGDAPAAAAPVKTVAPKLTVHKTDFEKDVIYLYQFSRTPFLPSISPYCLKVETWLRLAGLKYENVDHKMKFRSKKGQLPFIELNGEEISDSVIIIKELGAKFDKDLNAGLTQDQRNIAHATISMIENHLVWVLLYWRMKNPDLLIKGYKVNLQHALGCRLPNSILNFFFRFTYGRRGCKRVKAQGIGVHKPEEIEEFGKNDLKVLSDILADKPFYFGDEPTILDVVSFAVLSQFNFISKEVNFPLRDYITEICPNLIGHVSRIKERCFPDWDEICSKLDLNAHLPKPEPEIKEGKEAETEKKAEQENNESDQIEKELEKDKVEEKEKENIEENKEKEEAK